MDALTLAGIQGFLLDVDGTLIDSNDAHARAWLDVFAEEGIRTSYNEVRSKIGMGGDHLIPAVSGISKDTDQGTRLDKRRGEIFREKYLPHLQAFPGARDLLVYLKERGFRLVVATSASKKDLQALLKQAGLEGIVDEQTNSSEAESSKPDPDIIQAALKKGGFPPAGAIMLGDTPYDIKAAEGAGVRTIGFTCGGWAPEDLSGAVLVVEDPADLLAKLKTGYLNLIQ